MLLAQLLDNLLDNALKYSDTAVDLTVDQQNHELLIGVKDRGPGVAPQDQAQLFEPFVRGSLTRGQRGAGLGLAVCRAIARAHGGDLVWRSRSGGGTSFTLSLPVAPQQPLQDAHEALP